MKLSFMRAAAVCAATLIGGAAYATSVPAVGDSYVGNYDLNNAFGGHGLWLPGFLGDHTWSVTGGTANYDGTTMSLNGSVENNVGGTTYSMNFDFLVTQTSNVPAAPYCGSGQACQSITQDMKDNMVYFDMGANSIMGTVTGTGALAGLSMDLVMRPLGIAPDPNKPGQLGYGGNWTNLDFGYSNWLTWSVTSSAQVSTGSSGSGDVNLTFTGNGNPGGGNNPPPVPLPAGLPLLLTGLAGMAWMRRKQRV